MIFAKDVVICFTKVEEKPIDLTKQDIFFGMIPLITALNATDYLYFVLLEYMNLILPPLKICVYRMKKSTMRNILFPAFIILLAQVGLFAQTNPQPVYPPKVNDFAPILNFMASPALEGRETGQQGSAVAAEYIASMMQHLGLKPYKTNGGSNYRPTDYFQEFRLLRQTAGNASVDVIVSKEQKPELQLRAGSDFKVFNRDKAAFGVRRIFFQHN